MKWGGRGSERVGGVRGGEAGAEGGGWGRQAEAWGHGSRRWRGGSGVGQHGGSGQNRWAHASQHLHMPIGEDPPHARRHWPHTCPC